MLNFHQDYLNQSSDQYLKMGQFHLELLDLQDEFKLYCGYCHVQLCYNFEIISTDYKCKNGKALFVSLV
jgi:hypothetical protein